MSNAHTFIEDFNPFTDDVADFLLRLAGDPIAAQAISSYEFGKCIGTARGLAVARNIYEAELQSMRDRLSRMEEAGNAMREFIKDGIPMSKLPDMPLSLVSGWDALSNK